MSTATIGRPATGPVHGRARASVLVIDRPVVQQGVALFLGASTAPTFTLQVAATAAEAVAAARRARPDIALLDPVLPDMLLEDLVERLRASSPNTRLVAFAARATPTLRDEIGRLGVEGFVSKDAGASELAATLAAVAGGARVPAPSGEPTLRLAADKLRCAMLTDREHEILRLAARGSNNAEIAAEIYLAPTTVKSYLQSALAKLGARNRVEAVFKLSELGAL